MNKALSNISIYANIAVVLGKPNECGKIWNEKKFKHLSGTDQLFEFKVDDSRVICFFFIGRRVILTHGFQKKGKKTPVGELNRATIYKAEFESRARKLEEKS